MRALDFFLIFPFLLLSYPNLFGQEMAADKMTTLFESKSGSKKIEKKEGFTFESYISIEDELANVSDYDSHYLGDEVAKRLKAVNNLYVAKSDVAVGFGDSHTSFIKPDILNAIYKIDRFYKKAVRKDEISEKLAENKMAHFLEIAMVIFYESDSEKFEEALRKNNGPETLIKLFEEVEIEKL